MPRLGQLLSALLIALIGVLVVQMFLLAGMQQRLAIDQPTPPATANTISLSAPALDPPLGTAPIPDDAAQKAPPVQQTLVIIITPGDPTPAMEEPNGGRDLIERFIELSSNRLADTPPSQEDV